jgi:hypothetical protein
VVECPEHPVITSAAIAATGGRKRSIRRGQDAAIFDRVASRIRLSIPRV